MTCLHSSRRTIFFKHLSRELEPEQNKPPTVDGEDTLILQEQTPGESMEIRTSQT